MVNISFHTDAFNSVNWSFEQCLQWAKDHDLKYIECGTIDGSAYIQSLGYYPHISLLEDPILWRRKLESYGIQFSQLDAAYPLTRALRPDKLCLAALHATLLAYVEGVAEAEIPVWRMIAAPNSELERRAGAWAAALGGGLNAEIIPAEATVGGGSLPGQAIPSVALRIVSPERSPDELAAALEPLLNWPPLRARFAPAPRPASRVPCLLRGCCRHRQSCRRPLRSPLRRFCRRRRPLQPYRALAQLAND